MDNANNGMSMYIKLSSSKSISVGISEYISLIEDLDRNIKYHVTKCKVNIIQTE
jgi:adenosine/AMP kinase